MSQSIQSAGQEIGAPPNGQSAVHDLFALTDEQILEIEPEAQDGARSGESRVASREALAKGDESVAATDSTDVGRAAARTDSAAQSSSTSHQSPVTSHAAAEPPHWVAEAMNDPQRGGEVRAFWEGAQKAQQEAAAYREVFPKPEEARSAAERARVLDDIDRAYFGATGDSAEQTSAARAQLAQTMLRENPAAFREMVFAGLRALEEIGKQGSTEAGNPHATTGVNETGVHAGQQPSQESSTAGRDDMRNAQFTAYAAFEKAANQELEQSVGRVIANALGQALPHAGTSDGGGLKEKLGAAIRQEVEKALQGDRQLGEQIGQILSARRFDNETRTQVVRLIDERAKQLVPGAAKRVLQDWTQTTLATHRSRTRQNEAAAARSDLAPANSAASNPPPRSAHTSRESGRNDNRGGGGTKVDYHKLSDEQILEM